MMNATLGLIRYKNLLLLLLIMMLAKYGVLSIIATTTALSDFQFLLLIVSVISISAGGYIVNDVYDVVTDSINKPHRLIIGNTISMNSAWRLYGVTTALGLVSAIYLCFSIERPMTLLFFVVPVLLLFSYSKYFKRLPVIGNLIISFLAALVIFIVFAMNNTSVDSSNAFAFDLFTGIDFVVWYFMFFSFLTTFIREIIKDIEDVQGDYQQGMKTLPIIIGRHRARNIAIFLSIVFAFSIILVNQQFIGETPFFLLGLYNYAFIFLPLLYFIYVLWNADKPKTFTLLSNYMKWMMLLGILSMSILII